MYYDSQIKLLKGKFFFPLQRHFFQLNLKLLEIFLEEKLAKDL